MNQFLKFIFGIKVYMFRTVPLFIIRSFSLYTQQWHMSYGFADSWQHYTSHQIITSDLKQQNDTDTSQTWFDYSQTSQSTDEEDKIIFI